MKVQFQILKDTLDLRSINICMFENGQDFFLIVFEFVVKV